MFQPKEEACRVRIASSGCRVRRGPGSGARLYIKSRVHMIFWVTQHDTKLPHDFLKRGADREIYSLVNRGTVWKASDMTKADICRFVAKPKLAMGAIRPPRQAKFLLRSSPW
jgi:hypothetical protein